MSGGDELIAISGFQHFAFCQRQWALIHVERQWKESFLTAQGRVMHERAHEAEAELRGDTLTVRGLEVRSMKLGIYGVCDVVEFKRDERGVSLAGRKGRWRPVPVEYKHGSSKADDCDRLQVCAQAICLEEMLCCTIENGQIFYGRTRRRESFALTDELRGQVERTAALMREYLRRGYTPKAKQGPHCAACSMKELCLPEMCGGRSARRYMDKLLEEERI